MTFQEAYNALIARLPQFNDTDELQRFENKKLSDGFTVQWHLERLRNSLAVLNNPDPSDPKNTELSELDFRVSCRHLTEFLEQNGL